MPEARFHSTISDIEPATWDRLFSSDNPFTRHAFLFALEESGCVSGDAGWQPNHLELYRDAETIALMPLYIKTHSYGEFVFDWGWAEAYERHGLDYYPKLLTAIPFTPSRGPRAGVLAGEDTTGVAAAIFDAIVKYAGQESMSGWHLLFPDRALADVFCEGRKGEILCRRDVQFHWQNRGYRDFGDYLSALRSSRRKNVRRERRRVKAQGVTVLRKTGAEISDRDWDAFYLCYATTYLKRSGHSGYLNRDFFDRIRAFMADQLMLVVAEEDGDVVASALFFFDAKRLYGRYWGSLREIPCMHFEACFYQGIEFCIEKELEVFDPGTQGEHKLLRGFEPHETRSLHWLADHRFRQAIADFLKRETAGTREYSERAQEFLPFRKSDSRSGEQGPDG